jgi:hypothetical protein
VPTPAKAGILFPAGHLTIVFGRGQLTPSLTPPFSFSAFLIVFGFSVVTDSNSELSIASVVSAPEAPPLQKRTEFRVRPGGVGGGVPQ